MTSIGSGFRDGPGDRPPPGQDDSAAARQDFGPRKDQPLGTETGPRDAIARGRKAAEVAERASLLRRRIDEALAPKGEETDDRRGMPTGMAPWLPGSSGPADAVRGDAAGLATPRREAAADRAAERIAEALAAEIAPVPGQPIGIRLSFAGIDIPLSGAEVTLRGDDVDVVLLGATGALSGAGVADDLVRSLARRFAGRRVTVSEAPADAVGDAEPGPFAAIRAILGGRA